MTLLAAVRNMIVNMTEVVRPASGRQLSYILGDDRDEWTCYANACVKYAFYQRSSRFYDQDTSQITIIIIVGDDADGPGKADTTSCSSRMMGDPFRK